VAMAPGKVRVDWDAEASPLVLVREPRSGQVLADASGGEADLDTEAPELELLMSDGVRTTVRTVPVTLPGPAPLSAVRPTPWPGAQCGLAR
jgi:hypothetical protein